MSEVLKYVLPPERIAQRPTGYHGSRSDARLLHVRRTPDGLLLSDRFVHDLSSILRSGDLLVLNDSRVIPCRFFVDVNGIDGELFLVRPESARAPRADCFRDDEAGSDDARDVWECLARPMRRFRVGDVLELGSDPGILTGEVLGRSEDGERLRVRLRTDAGLLREVIEREGRMPIPPYIRDGRADDSDTNLYQTVVAAAPCADRAEGDTGGPAPGSVAAPTAGLHFTEALLAALQDVGVEVVTVTLHVGLQSIQPLRADASCATVSTTVPTEEFVISDRSWNRILAARREGRRIVSVGTTATRALESAALLGESFRPGNLHATSIFLRPGATFRMVDVLMTNFHQPQTTHLLLVSAFIGERETAEIYEHALREEYRFLSYGDAMLLEIADTEGARNE